MTFELYGREEQNYLAWVLEHDRTCEERRGYHGAIHIGDTFSFTQTSVGHVVKVECVCGKKENITDYDCW